MSVGLAADFVLRFPNGPAIEAAFALPVPNAVTVLFGPSGVGKTTVLRCLAGLERPSRGRIAWGKEPWFDATQGVFLSPQRRGIGFLFQEVKLFPHLSVANNVGYGLRGLGARERAVRVKSMLHVVGLSALADRRPNGLSGGERQRIALARALAPWPRLLLLDEPLAALDAATRVQLRGELRRLLVGQGIPALVVTHDRVEAIALGDAALVMVGGRVCQSGPIGEVFARPVSLEAARILGVENVQAGCVTEVVEGLATVMAGRARLVALASEGIGVGGCAVCIRAEDVTIERGAKPATSARNRLEARVVSVLREGPVVRVGLDCGFPLTALVTNQACEELGVRQGQPVMAVVKATAIHLVSRG